MFVWCVGEHAGAQGHDGSGALGEVAVGEGSQEVFVGCVWFA